MIGTYKSGNDPYLWFVYGAGTINYTWGEFFSGGAFLSSQWLTVATRGAAEPGHLPYINLSSEAVDPIGDHRTEDRVTFDLGGTHNVILKDVEYVDSTLTAQTLLRQFGHYGFSTDGSLDAMFMDVGNHDMHFTTAIKDSSLHLGDGWDTVTLDDHLDVPGIQYWSLIRRDFNELDAYSLLTGRHIRLEDGAESRNGQLNYTNFGEVEQLFLDNSRTGGTEEYKPGNGTDIPNGGDRGTVDNIDLRSDEQAFSDSFNLAYFNFIRYTSDNVWVGEATIHDGTIYSAASDRRVATDKNIFINSGYNYDAPVLSGQLSVIGQSRNGTHDLIVAEQAQAIDGKFRVYAFDVDSGLYNEFNEVFLGTSGNDGANKSGINGTNWSNRVALYGFGGEDILLGGAGRDYLFGGQSVYNQLNVNETGNQITGGIGADYFGVGNTNSLGAITGANTTIGSAATGYFHQGYATDVIMDWSSTNDTLVVLSNGVAVIAGLRNGADLVESLTGANVIDFRDHAAIATSDQDFDGARGGDAFDLSADLYVAYNNQGLRDDNSITNELDISVVNAGLIVARGLAGADTIFGSAGDDYLYGNEASNLIVLSEGGSDRVYYDTFDASLARQYVADFTTSDDQFFANKRVIDAFGGNTGRALSAVDVTGTYSAAVKYNPDLNFLHDKFYSPSILDTNANHNTQDGTAPGYLSGSDGKTFTIGAGMMAAGYVLMAIPFGQIAGAALLATGGVLSVGSVVVGTQEHVNATFTGNVGNYLNVITSSTLQAAGTTAVATSSAMNNSNVRFLDFFGSSNAGDGFIPVVEFTAHAGQGIYGYFALHSNNETFVFLVASRDNLVENGEAIKVAEINGLLTASDFAIYDGQADIYNTRTEAAVVLLDPTVTSVRDSGSPADQALVDRLIDDVQSAVLIDVLIGGDVAGGSYLRVYDKTTLIYDGSAGSLVNANVTANLVGRTYTISDNRSLGTVAMQTDTQDLVLDNNFVLYDSVVNYSVEFVDGTTGIPTRDGSGSITITGGNATIDGGGGKADSINITGTSDYLNGASDAQFVNIETIYLGGDDTNQDSVVDALDAPVYLDLSNQTDGFTIYGTVLGDSIVGSQGDDNILALDGQDTIALGSGGADQVAYTYTANLGNDASYDVITGMSSNDSIFIVASGLADTDNDGNVDNPTAGFDDRDGDAATLLYETAVLTSNKALSSATELLIVSDSAVGTSGSLTANIATALGSAFDLSGLDGRAPTSTTGAGTDSSVIFAVKSDVVGTYWVGRYEDTGNDDTIANTDIEVFAKVSLANILDGFWLSTVQAPQVLSLTMPADTGPIETAPARYYTQNLSVSVTGLDGTSATQQLLYSLNGGANWTFNAVGDTTFDLADNTAYNAGDIVVRSYDAGPLGAEFAGTTYAAGSLPAGNYGSNTTASARAVTTDNLNPNAPSAAPDLAAADDNGTSATDNITTNTSSLTFSGTVDANSVVRLFSASTQVAQVTADGSGAYTMDVSLVLGHHEITVQASDLAGNFSPSSPKVDVVISYQDISSGNSLSNPNPSGAVQINNTNFAGVETINGTAYVLSSLTATKSLQHVSSWMFDKLSDAEVITTQQGLVTVGDAYTSKGTVGASTGYQEVIANNASDVAFAISGMTLDAAFQNTKSFFFLEGNTDTKVAGGANDGYLWYWNDTGDGVAQTGELTLVAARGTPDPQGMLQYVVDIL